MEKYLELVNHFPPPILHPTFDLNLQDQNGCIPVIDKFRHNYNAAQNNFGQVIFFNFDSLKLFLKNITFFILHIFAYL
jgi:hypothetical protein